MRVPKLRGRVPGRVPDRNLDKDSAPSPRKVVTELVAKGAVRDGHPVKVLGSGDLTPGKVQVSANAFSASAKEKIAAAGGTVYRGVASVTGPTTCVAVR